MNKHIVIINGFGRAGKDSFVHAAAKFAYVMNFSSVDKIKKFYGDYYFEYLAVNEKVLDFLYVNADISK